jgi:hypothetical protein
VATGLLVPWYETRPYTAAIAAEAGEYSGGFRASRGGAERANQELHVIRDFIFLILFFILLGIWLVSWAAYHIAGGFIHLLLIVAVISLLVHFFRGPRSV